MTHLTSGSAATRRPLDPDAAISVRGLNKQFGTTKVLHDLDFDVPVGSITGLLGRNGAGKTTAMTLISGQDRPTSGEIRVFGADPYENPDAMAKLCFARENQKYPESFRVSHVLGTAPWFFNAWDQELADMLAETFRLPTRTLVKKLSRGQLSAVAIIVALASRSPLTFLDEPYLGLDATARQLFYDVLLQDHLAHPRTILMSTHLIDEASDLFEKILVIHDGKIVMDTTAEEAQAAAYSIAGPVAAVDAVVRPGTEVHRRRIGGLVSVTVEGRPDAAVRQAAAQHRLEVGPVGLQELVAALGTGSGGWLGPESTTHEEIG